MKTRPGTSQTQGPVVSLASRVAGICQKLETLGDMVASSAEGWSNVGLSLVSHVLPTPLQNRPIGQELIGEPSLTPMPRMLPWGFHDTVRDT